MVVIITSAWQGEWKLTLTALAATMAVNTLVTGLIVFKILKAFKFLEVKQTLSSFSSAPGRPNYQHIAFILIESGMALFAAHLARIVISILMEVPIINPSWSQSLAISIDMRLNLAFALIVSFHQMLDVIISSVHFYSVTLLIIFTWLGHRTNNNFGAGRNGIVLR